MNPIRLTRRAAIGRGLGAGLALACGSSLVLDREVASAAQTVDWRTAVMEWKDLLALDGYTILVDASADSAFVRWTRDDQQMALLAVSIQQPARMTVDGLLAGQALSPEDLVLHLSPLRTWLPRHGITSVHAFVVDPDVQRFLLNNGFTYTLGSGSGHYEMQLALQ